jgi:hypothetical protein
MDGVMFAIIIFLAIAGPTLLALYWWRNPDRRLSWRRALEESSGADRDHFRRPSWRTGWPFMGGGDSRGGAAAIAAAAPAKARWCGIQPAEAVAGDRARYWGLGGLPTKQAAWPHH